MYTIVLIVVRLIENDNFFKFHNGVEKWNIGINSYCYGAPSDPVDDEAIPSDCTSILSNLCQ